MHWGFGFGGFIDKAVGLSNRDQLLSDLTKDEKLMARALLVAMNSNGLSSPNPVVGCVLVDKDGNIVTEGATLAYGEKHAETVAIEKIKNLDVVKGGTAYVTLEPCSHFGKQPPCVNALVQLGLKKCFIASADPNPKVNHHGIETLKKHGVDVHIGLLKQEAVAWNYAFFTGLKLNRPLVALKWAQSLDGALADASGTSQWISGAKARKYTHWLRAHYDAIMVGAGTVLADRPQLSARESTVIHRQPVKVLFDPACELVNALGKLADTTLAGDQKIIWITADALDENILKGKTHLYNIVVDKHDPVTDCLQKLSSKEVSELAGRQIQSVFVEGGPTLLSQLLHRDLADVIHCYVSPLMLGLGKTILGSQSQPTRLADAARYKTLATYQLEDDVLIELVPQDRYQKFFI
ncbi:MAG: bifunctional diaminohydroxyphosphoribosylaminopyrimidine deaminase/5-amino-6-(5-phosphoribosylamino)uracil reductase RibD [Oligoflexales bacterium]